MGKYYYEDKYYRKNENRNKEKGLTEIQQKFVYWYCLNNNAFKSAKLAGYKESFCYEISKKMLNNPKIVNHIIARKNEMMAEKGIIGSDIIRKYIDIAFSDLGDYVEINSNGRINFENQKNIDYSLVKKISSDKKGVSIELKDDMKALQWLAEYFGIDPKHKLNISKFDQSNKIEEFENILNNIKNNLKAQS